ncbi:hypothetical protein [Roseivirga echinicomitans]|uniref:Uncharacterized protein n=1 Tax=Roseivirga echinicomitans TaxID=296218 RepID=A0A150X282_9BACT|nr:hypothetical protein [Roseivirga echinicomitans]KYG72829.1 hypothetical protein AWN68_09005 [Roseivirga echinicomitans]
MEFDQLEDLTHRVIGQVNDDLISYLKTKPSDGYQNGWEQILDQAKEISLHEFVFKYEFSFMDLLRESFLKADLNGRKIKKAAVLYNKEFEGIEEEYERDFYDSYDDIDFRKALKYSLIQFHQLIREW